MYIHVESKKMSIELYSRMKCTFHIDICFRYLFNFRYSITDINHD